MTTTNARAKVAGHFRALVAKGTADLAGADALDILRWTDEHLAGSYIVASGTENAVLIHLASRVRPGVDVIFLDSQPALRENTGTCRVTALGYDVNVVTVLPEYDMAERLAHAMRGYCGWVTGLRRTDSTTRADTPVIAFDDVFGVVKVNPLAAWTDEDVELYIEAHGILVNPFSGRCGQQSLEKVVR